MMEKESDRLDQTPKLGKPLTMLELQCHLLIYSYGEEPISAYDLSTQLYGVKPNSNISNITKRVWDIVGNIRKKLGANSIITEMNKGYITRRAKIEENTGNRDPLEVVDEIRQGLNNKSATST